MCDSDSDDDDLFGAPTFGNTRREKAGEKSREKGLAFLDESLEHEKRRREYNENIVKIKQEQSECDEERLAQAESLAKESLSLSSKKRKATQDAIDGVDEGLEGLAGGCDKLATALDTSQSKMLGSRATLGRAHLTNQWSSTQDAVDELSVILTRFESNKSFGNKRFKKEAISLIRNAIQGDALEPLLSYGQLVELCRKHGLAQLPCELSEWLYCLACKPVHGGTDELSTAAFQTQLLLWRSARGPPKRTFLTMNDLIRDMKAWFALRLDGLEGKENEDRTDVSSVSGVDVTGLEHFLLLWERALLNDIIWLGELSAKDAVETATRSMIALALAGLDPCFHRCESLKVSLQRVFCAFLAFLERKVLEDEDSKNDWIESAAIAMLDECRQLGPGLNIKEEKDDTEFWLCLPLVVRTVSMFERRVPVDQIHQKLRAAMAVRALQMCLGIGDWDKHLLSVLSSHGETNLAEWAISSFRCRALASSVVGFLTIPSLGDTLLRDGQRCLATVENLSLCTLAGLNIEVSTDSQEHSSVIFGNQEEASLVLHVIDLLDAQGRQLGKQVSRFSTDPLFSRAEHHLSCIRGSFDLIKTAGRTSAGLAGPTVSVQKRIDQMFGFAPASDDEDDSA